MFKAFTLSNVGRAETAPCDESGLAGFAGEGTCGAPELAA